MKIMFASDLHGSAAACRALVDLFERERAARLVLLGDLLYHGPRNPLPEGYAPMEVAAMLNGLRQALLCVRGNCDAEVDQLVLDFPMRADYALLDLDGRAALLTHGHLMEPSQWPALTPGMAYVQGHTHVAMAQKQAHFLHLNPGSVALPKEGPASYMIYEDGCFFLRNFARENLAALAWDAHADA